MLNGVSREVLAIAHLLMLSRVSAHTHTREIAYWLIAACHTPTYVKNPRHQEEARVRWSDQSGSQVKFTSCECWGLQSSKVKVCISQSLTIKSSWLQWRNRRKGWKLVLITNMARQVKLCCWYVGVISFDILPSSWVASLAVDSSWVGYCPLLET